MEKEKLELPKSKIRVTFHLTNACNLACKYCYENHGNKVMPVQYGKDLIDEIINLLLHQEASFLYDYLNCETYTTIELDFIGGEATLYMDIIDELCNYFTDRCFEAELFDILSNYQIILETNGTTYFNTDVQDFLIRHAGRVNFPITTDGCKDCFDYNRLQVNNKSTFETVDLAIKDYIEKYKVIPDSKLTFIPETFQYIKQSCQYLQSLGYTHCRMNVDVNLKMNRAQTDAYYAALCDVIDWVVDNQIEFLPDCLYKNSFKPVDLYSYCGMLGQRIVVDYNGDLFNCFRFSDSSLGDKEMPIGSIITKTIDFNFINDFIDKAKYRSHTNPKCKDCPIMYACEECPIVNFTNTGSLDKSFNNCGEIIALAKAHLYLKQRIQETDYPYFKEELAKVENDYDPNFKYLLDWEEEEQQAQQEK